MSNGAIISSGITGLSTSSADPVTAIDMPDGGFHRVMKNIMISNEGVAGFFSMDSGNTWGRMPGNDVTILREVYLVGDVQIKRETSDLSGVFISIW
jgi:hypothetical protein